MTQTRWFPRLLRASIWGMRRAIQVELLLALLIAVFGFGSFGFESAWYHEVLPATQLPGTLLLSELGLCCGYANGLVIADEIGNRYGGLTLIGVPLLAAANVIALSLLFACLRTLGDHLPGCIAVSFRRRR